MQALHYTPAQTVYNHLVTSGFYGYKHWMLETIPRCFYVGKGVKKRPFEDGNARSTKWRAVAERFGLRVEVCLGPVTDAEAIAWEIETIVNKDTYTTSYSTQEGADIRCNFTRGGDGASGYKHKPEFIAELRKRGGLFKGHRHTPASRLKMSKSHKGVPKPLGFGAKISASQNQPVCELDQHGNIIAKYASGVEASKLTGVTRSSISYACRSGKPVNGRRWAKCPPQTL